MGNDATKARLDNQLDAFFGRSGTVSNTTPSNVSSVRIKVDHLGDPSGKEIFCNKINIFIFFKTLFFTLFYYFRCRYEWKLIHLDEWK